MSAFTTLTVGSATGQTIQGNGTLGASLDLEGNGTANPGFTNQIGTLVVSNDVTLNGTVNMELNRTNSVGGTNDQISGAAIILGGTLNVTNIGPVLQVGDTFKLFKNTGTLTGTFGTVNLATNDANGAGYTWTDNTAVDGTIKVLTVTAPPATNPNPTNLTFSVSGGNLNLSWPADHIGWTLQQSTNLTNNVWLDVPGSTTINTTNIPIGVTNPVLFYRMKL